MAQGIDFDTKTYSVFYTCAALLILKIFLMVPLTVRLRILKKVVMNPEDTRLALRGTKVKFNDPDIERVRRAHLNDLENIPIFISTGFLYTSLKPNPIVAIALIVAFTIARYAHTFVYLASVKQPSRFICYTVGYLITAYMATYVVLSVKD